MTENTRIEWADHTFNPWIGCTKVGPGCDGCYAEQRMDKRLHVVQWGAGQPRKRTSAANWKAPLLWNAQAADFWKIYGHRQRVFCASLSDVFDNEVPTDWRRELFDMIERTPHLDWLLLTKRIGNAREMLEECYFGRWAERVRANILLGATVVNQSEAERDIPKLLAVPAARRFLSIEPMLGPVDIQAAINRMPWQIGGGAAELHWVICGGESGPKARPMHPDWARSLRDECQGAGVPFLFKQWGEWAPFSKPSHYPAGVTPDGSKVGPDEQFTEDCALMYRIGKKAAGRVLDGMTHDGFPEGGAA
jgi:protein gp37